MMAVLSRDAQSVLDHYLRRVRASLRGHRTVDVEDVERDVEGHIQAALAGQPEPIDAANLRQVLDRLGSPEQWVPSDDLPPWRTILARLSSGPEDWRLPYLTFICFVTGLTLFLTRFGMVGLWPFPVILLLASFLLARASLAVMAASGTPVEPRRWLIYPALLLWYIPVAITAFGWPAPFVAGADQDVPALTAWVRSLVPEWEGASIAAAVSIVLGTWWIVLGLLATASSRLVRTAFWPFAESISARHTIGVSVAGGVLVAITWLAISVIA